MKLFRDKGKVHKHDAVRYWPVWQGKVTGSCGATGPEASLFDGRASDVTCSECRKAAERVENAKDGS